MKRIIKILFLTFFLTTICQICFAQVKDAGHSKKQRSTHLITGIHTLSIHVRDTATHDSVYQFLKTKLQLPTYYNPIVIAGKRYVGIYAGNIVLEPCGPYHNIEYATGNFRSIFFGMNFEVSNSLDISVKEMDRRGIKQQVNRGSIYLKDSILCSDNLFTALYNVTDNVKRDSLRNMMITNPKNNPGIEYIKEIQLGYKDGITLNKWKQFFEPLQMDKSNFYQINDSLKIHFIKSEINEVKGISFKVKSLKKAQQYFKQSNLISKVTNDKIELDKLQTLGLTMYFSENR